MFLEASDHSQIAVILLLVLFESAFFYVDALQEKVDVDFGIDFPDDLMLELVEEGQVCCAVRPERLWARQKRC